MPADAASGSLGVRPGNVQPAMERRPSLAPAEELTTGAVRKSRWSGIRRPDNGQPVK
jgi:hypothetical protein